MNTYKTLAREMLSAYVDVLRNSRKLTQEEMAERLRISSRAYSDLERGKYCFSTITLLFLLLMLSEEEVMAFLQDMRRLVEQQAEAEDAGYDDVLEIG